jgi:hypothetical protein
MIPAGTFKFGRKSKFEKSARENSGIGIDAKRKWLSGLADRGYVNKTKQFSD